MLRIHSFLISLVSILLCFSGVSAGQQLWSGIINPARATDWTSAGVVGGIPSGSWTQCGSTIAAYSGNAATINSAIAACGSNQYVLLGAGTFSLSSGINFAHKSNVVLRGSGANSTFLIFSGAGISCTDGSALICINSSDGTYGWNPSLTTHNWTAGYSQGTTQVTLGSTSGVSTSTILALNQCNTGYSGSPCSGTATGNGNFFNCSAQYNAAGPVGCSQSGEDGGNGTAGRFQTELFQVTNVNSSTGVVTLGAGLKHPNWASGQTPQAWYFTPIQNAGVENLSVDATGSGSSSSYGIMFYNALNVWVKGIRVINGYTSPLAFIEALHFTAQDSYFYEAQSGDNFGVHLTVTTDGLVQNNVFQQINVPVIIEGSDTGSVIAYNFTILNCNYLSASANCKADNVDNSFRPHSNGTDYQLYEGNVGTNYYADKDHGSHLSQTAFRNFFTGWESCGTSGPCGSVTHKDFGTNSILLASFEGRYHNLIANVLGTPGFHSTYQFTTNAGYTDLAIYGIGMGASGVADDSIVGATLMRWGNYDVVHGSVQWNTSEVPSGISVYPNSAPTTTCTASLSCPASFYLTSKPAWFGSTPWPAVGPDITGGNVGQCTGTRDTSGEFALLPALSGSQCTGTSLSASAWGGHVNAIPAMACYLNKMGGPPDGSGSALAFDAGNCYAGSGGGTPPPTGLTASVH